MKAHRANRVRGPDVTLGANMEISKGTFMESRGRGGVVTGHPLLKIDNLSPPESGFEPSAGRPPTHQRLSVLSIIRFVSTPARRRFSRFSFRDCNSWFGFFFSTFFISQG